MHLKPWSPSCYLDTTYFCWLIPTHNFGPLQPQMQSKWSPRYPSNDRRETQGGDPTLTPAWPSSLQPTFSICLFPIHFPQACSRQHPSLCENRSRQGVLSPGDIRDFLFVESDGKNESHKQANVQQQVQVDISPQLQKTPAAKSHHRDGHSSVKWLKQKASPYFLPPSFLYRLPSRSDVYSGPGTISCSFHSGVRDIQISTYLHNSGAEFALGTKNWSKPQLRGRDILVHCRVYLTLAPSTQDASPIPDSSHSSCIAKSLLQSCWS